MLRGHSLINFDPEIIALGKNKVPDFKVHCPETGEYFYTEVSIMEVGKDLKNNRRLTDSLRFPIQYAGRLIKNLPPTDLDVIIAEIELKMKQAYLGNELVKIYHEGILELGIAPDSQVAALDTWCEERGLKRGSCYIPQDNFDPTSQIRSKIRNEQKQLKENLPNVIFIKMDLNNSLFFDKATLIRGLWKIYKNINMFWLLCCVTTTSALHRRI